MCTPDKASDVADGLARVSPPPPLCLGILPKQIFVGLLRRHLADVAEVKRVVIVGGGDGVRALGLIFGQVCGLWPSIRKWSGS